MQDARLISRLRAGEGAAVGQLWETWKTAIWSVCRGMATDTGQARLLLQDIYLHLPVAVRGWSLDASVCCQLSELVWQRLARLLELPVPGGIDVAMPERTVAPSRAQVADKLAAIPPEHRVFYLLDVFFRCPAATLAALAGCAEADVRAARAAAAWRLVAAGPEEAR